MVGPMGADPSRKGSAAGRPIRTHGGPGFKVTETRSFQPPFSAHLAVVDGMQKGAQERHATAPA